MSRVGRQHPGTPRVLIRGLLLSLVLAGVFGMHVLTDEDGGSGHGLPVISKAGHVSGMTGHSAASLDPGAMSATTEKSRTASQMGAAVVLAPDPGTGVDDGAMAGCILFLVAGAAALVFALLRYRRSRGFTGLGRAVRAALTDVRRRGPPGRYRPRIALCVIRI